MKQTNERLCALAQKGDAAALDSLIDNNKSFIGKLRLAYVVLFHQVRKTDVGRCGQIFLCHVVGPPFGVFALCLNIRRILQKG